MIDCPYLRVEIIGVGGNNMNVMIWGSPAGIPLEKCPELGILDVGAREEVHKDTFFAMRVNNVTLRQDGPEHAIRVFEKNHLELDTISLFSRWTSGIVMNNNAFVLLRNATITCTENAIQGGMGLIILNSLFDNCGSSRDEIEGDTRYGDYSTILLENHTNFLFWASQVRNSKGHAIGKIKRTPIGVNELQQYSSFFQRLAYIQGEMLGGPSFNPTEALGTVLSEMAASAKLPEGYRCIREVKMVGNKACTELCAVHLMDSEKCYCPNIDEEANLKEKQGFLKILGWIEGCVEKEGGELVEEHREAMKEWELGGLVDPNFLSAEEWKQYREQRRLLGELNRDGNKKERKNNPHITRKKVREEAEGEIKKVLEKSSFSKEMIERFVKSVLFLQIRQVREKGDYHTFQSSCRVYSLCGNGGYIEISFISHLRGRCCSEEDFDEIWLTFVGQTRGRNMLEMGKSLEGVLLFSREVQYEDDSEDVSKDDEGVLWGWGGKLKLQKRIEDKEELGETIMFEMVQKVLFGKKMMSLPMVVELLWAVVGGGCYSRCKTEVSFAVELARKREEFWEGEKK